MGRYIPRSRCIWLVATLLVLFAAVPRNAGAQGIQLETSRGPHYVGEPVILQVTVESIDSNIEVSCRLKSDPPDGMAVEGPQVGRSVQSFMQSFNGRVTRSETVTYRFTFAATASRKGEFTVGPFEVTVGGQAQEIAGESFTFGDLVSDPDMQIELSLPPQSIYVGQEVPLTIRWTFAGDINAVRHAFGNLQIRSPIFDQFPFRDDPVSSRTTLSIATAKGVVEVNAVVTQEKADGRDLFVVTATRTLVPDSPGEFPSIPVTCRTRKVTQWGRDLFGDLRARRDAPAVAAGEPLSLTVKSIPLADRPPSYSGAIGRGFSVDVSANRSVVRVGDPISLTITVRGDGNFESISIPALDSNAGFAADQFQIPQEQVAGTIDGNQKQFHINIRVKNQSVTQIPAIDFSWFDPYEEKFSTVSSKPIALQVMDAQVISAADVVSGSKGQRAASTSESAGGQATQDSAQAPGELTFVGANLAIVRDPARLLLASGSVAEPQAIAWGCYLLAAIALAGGMLVRRRSNVDQRVVERKRQLQSIRQQIDAAAGRSPQESAAHVARALRQLAAGFVLHDRSRVDQLIARCDNLIYATGSADESQVAKIVEEARAVVRETSIS